MNSEERREVAARLRGVTEEELSYAFLGEIINFTVGGRCLDDEGDIDERLILNRLADLIDPTCHLVGTTSEEVLYGTTIFRHELSCGHTRYTGWPEPPAFCDECGARVVEEE